MPHTLDFNCALITGGGGGLGRAMAEYLLSKGKKIIICGRTKDKLQKASAELGNAPSYVLDTGDIPSIRPVIRNITDAHPELDCLINNAGVQRPLDISMSAEEFLEKADQEVAININGPMHLTMELLPHFRAKDFAVVMNVSSVLGFNPTSVINPVYNGTKAWVHFWSMNLRTQLEKAGSNIRVVEIVPPTVATDLHRERENPNDNSKAENPSALSIDEFMESVVSHWENDTLTFGVGPGEKIVQTWNKAFLDDYNNAVN